MEKVNSQISSIELINRYGIVYNGDDYGISIPLSSDKEIADAIDILELIYPLSMFDKHRLRYLMSVHNHIQRLTYDRNNYGNLTLSIKFNMQEQSKNTQMFILVPKDINYIMFIAQKHTFVNCGGCKEYANVVVLDDNNLMSFPLNFDCYPEPIEFKINNIIHNNL